MTQFTVTTKEINFTEIQKKNGLFFISFKI